MATSLNSRFISHARLPARGHKLATYTLFFFLGALCVVPVKILIGLAAVALVILLLFQEGKVKAKGIIFLMPFIFLLIIGFLYAYNHPLFDVVKDVWYTGKIIIGLSLGYLLASYITSFRTFCRVLIYAAVILAIAHIIQATTAFIGGASIWEMRSQNGISGYFITTIGLALLLAMWKHKKYIVANQIVYLFSIALCSFSIIISFSRSSIVLLLVLLLILKGWRLNLKTVFKIAGVAFVTLVFYLNVSISESDNKSLLSKFNNSLSEIAIQDYQEKRDININWRGYESYRALLEFQNGDVLQYFFGQGLGQTIDLGFYIPLGGKSFRYIPILHNGYMYIIVKFGLLGIALYLYFLFSLMRFNLKVKVKHRPLDEVIARRFIAGLGFVFLLTTVVIAGPFNSGMFSMVVLVGFLSGWINQHKSIS